MVQCYIANNFSARGYSSEYQARIRDHQKEDGSLNWRGQLILRNLLQDPGLVWAYMADQFTVNAPWSAHVPEPTVNLRRYLASGTVPKEYRKQLCNILALWEYAVSYESTRHEIRKSAASRRLGGGEVIMRELEQQRRALLDAAEKAIFDQYFGGVGK